MGKRLSCLGCDEGYVYSSRKKFCKACRVIQKKTQAQVPPHRSLHPPEPRSRHVNSPERYEWQGAQIKRAPNDSQPEE